MSNIDENPYIREWTNDSEGFEKWMAWKFNGKQKPLSDDVVQWMLCAWNAAIAIANLHPQAKQEQRPVVDIEALFRAFAKAVQETANTMIYPHHCGKIDILEDEIQWWLKYAPKQDTTNHEALLVKVREEVETAKSGVGACGSWWQNTEDSSPFPGPQLAKARDALSRSLALIDAKPKEQHHEQN